MIEQRTKWIRTTQKYMNEVKLTALDIELQTKPGKMGYISCTSQYKLPKGMYISLTYSHVIYIIPCYFVRKLYVFSRIRNIIAPEILWTQT